MTTPPPAFALHARLAADTVPVATWALCRVLLMGDATYPWLILVPQRADITEIHHLSAADRATLMEEAARASAALAAAFAADKINVGALGNMVPQLHVHVVARRRADPAWPRPVWGHAPAVAYEPFALAERLASLRAAFGGEA